MTEAARRLEEAGIRENVALPWHHVRPDRQPERVLKTMALSPDSAPLLERYGGAAIPDAVAKKHTEMQISADIRPWYELAPLVSSAIREGLDALGVYGIPLFHDPRYFGPSTDAPLHSHLCPPILPVRRAVLALHASATTHSRLSCPEDLCSRSILTSAHDRPAVLSGRTC